MKPSWLLKQTTASPCIIESGRTMGRGSHPLWFEGRLVLHDVHGCQLTETAQRQLAPPHALQRPHLSDLGGRSGSSASLWPTTSRLEPFQVLDEKLGCTQTNKCKQPSGLACRALVMVVAVTSRTYSVKCARGKDRLHPLFDS